MQETLRLLRGLQELDEDLYRVKEELRRLPEERQRRRGRIEAEIERAKDVERRVHEIKTRIKEIEDMTTGQRQRLRKLENEIGKTVDQALIVAYQHEMRGLKRDIGEAEEEGLALVEEADTLEAEVAQLREGISGLEQEFAAYDENVKSELAQAEEKRNALDEERRTRMGGEVSGEILQRYEKLLDAREGQAMAMLDGRVCQGCYVSVPNNVYVQLARAVELVTCPSCNRILYLPEGN